MQQHLQATSPVGLDWRPGLIRGVKFNIPRYTILTAMIRGIKEFALAPLKVQSFF